MSVRCQDRTACSDNGGNGVYNDVASPRLKVVDHRTERRYSSLCSMFPCWTRLAERIVDFLMGLSDREFAVLCHHDGQRLVMNHEKLDLIGEALGDETITLILSDVDFGDEAGPSDRDLAAIDEPTAAELETVA